MKQELVLAVDIGTTATKAILFDQAGDIAGVARSTYPTYMPQQGWAEQDPDEVLQGVVEAVRAAVTLVPEGSTLSAVALSSQLYSIIPLDADGRPLGKSMIWMDRRAVEEADTLQKHRSADQLYQATGCPIDSIYPLSKIAWIKQATRPRKPVKYVSIKEYIVQWLTGQYVVDWSIASATGLFDIRQMRWHPMALDLIGISDSQLSDPVSPRHMLRSWRQEALAATGLPQGVPLVMGGGDGPLASLGSDAKESWQVAVNVGTSAAARRIMQQPVTDPTGRLWCYVADEGLWALGGIVSSGGRVADWFRTEIGPGMSACEEDDFEQLNQLASSIDAGADGLIFLPYLGGGQCPDWGDDINGCYINLTFSHTRAHLVRATWEGIARSIHRVIEVLENQGGSITEVRLSGGLAGSKAWVQLAADMFNKNVVIPDTIEGSAAGAARIAWAALGKEGDKGKEQWGRISETIRPISQNVAFYARQKELFLHYYRRIANQLTP